MRTIQIGLEVHKAIEAERQTLAETENDILMRLLFGEHAPVVKNVEDNSSQEPWVKDDVELPNGTKLRAKYSGQTLEGIVRDGQWVVNGRAFRSPSMALIHNVVTRDGRRTNINGWNHWDVKRPNDSNYVPLRALRR